MNKTALYIGAACLGAAAFYRYDYHPQQVRIECEKQATKSAQAEFKRKAESNWELRDPAEKGHFFIVDKEEFYTSCVRRHGFEPGAIK